MTNITTCIIKHDAIAIINIHSSVSWFISKECLKSAQTTIRQSYYIIIQRGNKSLYYLCVFNLQLFVKRWTHLLQICLSMDWFLFFALILNINAQTGVWQFYDHSTHGGNRTSDLTQLNQINWLYTNDTKHKKLFNFIAHMNAGIQNLFIYKRKGEVHLLLV